MLNVCTILIGKFKVTDYSKALKRRWEDNIEVDITRRDFGGVE
jgi:hypothetical protein